MAKTNLERVRAYQARNRELVRVRALGYDAKRRAKNRAKRCLETKRWAQANPEKVCHLAKRKRERKKNAPGSHTLEQWLARVEMFLWKCAYCKVPLAKATLTKDHRIPLSRGGSAWPANLVPACRSCNSRKNTKTVVEWQGLNG